jgi:hypothetical protein
VLVTVTVNVDEPAYRTPPLPAASQRQFLPGPGEGLPLPSMSLYLEGVIRIEGNLLRWVMGTCVVGSMLTLVYRLQCFTAERLHLVFDQEPALGAAYPVAERTRK